MFRNLQIRSKLGAILVLPLVALIVFASLQVGSSISRRAEANRTNLLTGLANRLTALTDSLQQERATSTGYVASGKGRFRPEMMQSRAKADRNAASLRDGLVDLDVSDYSARLRDDIADSSRRLDGLANWRTQLDGADLPTVTRVESFYGELLTSLLAVIADIGNEPGSRSVKADIAALVEISRAKEAASQSTSLLFAALIKGEFGPGDYPRFATLVGEESSSVARFESIASPAQQIQFDHQVAGASNSSLTEVMRQAALAGPGAPPKLDPQVWLATMSSKVGEYLKVEQRVASDVAAAATSDRDAAVRQMVLTTVIMILVLALAIGLSLLLSNSMARPLYALEKSARDVAEQHLPGVVERLQRPDAQVDEAGIEALAAYGGVPVRSRDEIGRVAGAFNSVHEVAIRIAAEQAALRNSIGAMFLNLARRSQRLVDRQLELIDELERDEAAGDLRAGRRAAGRHRLRGRDRGPRARHERRGAAGRQPAPRQPAGGRLRGVAHAGPVRGRAAGAALRHPGAAPALLVRRRDRAGAAAERAADLVRHGGPRGRAAWPASRAGASGAAAGQGEYAQRAADRAAGAAGHPGRRHAAAAGQRAGRLQRRGDPGRRRGRRPHGRPPAHLRAGALGLVRQRERCELPADAPPRAAALQRRTGAPGRPRPRPAAAAAAGAAHATAGPAAARARGRVPRTRAPCRSRR